MTKSLLPLLPRRRRRPRAARRLLTRFDLPRLFLGFVTFALLTLLMSIHFLPDRVSLHIGDRSPTDIRAARSVTYIDTEATARLRDAVTTNVRSVYDPDTSALAQASHFVTDVFDKVHRVRADETLTMVRRAERLEETFGSVFAPEQIRYLLALPVTSLDRLQETAQRLVQDEMNREIRSDTDDLAHARNSFNQRAGRMVVGATDAAILRAIGEQSLRPNEIYSSRKTERQREAARSAVRPVTGELRLNDVVVHQGEVFTQQHLDECTALGLIHPTITAVTALAISGMAGLMVLMVAFYVRRRYPLIYGSHKRLALLAVISLVSVLGLRLFGALGIPLSGVQIGYLGMMSVVAAGMLLSVLLNAPIAILVTALLSVQSGLILNHEIRFSVLTLFSSLIGIYFVSDIRDRTHLVRAVLALALTNLAMVWILGGLLGDTLNEITSGSVWAVLAAVFAVGIFWFGLLMLEKPFEVLTNAWLLELSASERPLLRELCLTAPGTYAHSLAVGNLAEEGAKAIGANALLCRVGSYYHDVGKIRRPHCFVENQGADNIHDRLNPSLSALILASHVRDGVEIADEYRLPRAIRDIIAQHHGTTLIRYFYHQALADCPADAQPDPVLEQHFRYEGPRPQTREAAIVMLADSCEAAARSLNKPSPARIQGLVESIFQDKVTDGQMDECDLTFKDLHKIREAFVRVLCAMLHGRIAYPNLPKPLRHFGTPAAPKDNLFPLPAEETLNETTGTLFPDIVTPDWAVSPENESAEARLLNSLDLPPSIAAVPMPVENENADTHPEPTDTSRENTAVVSRRSNRPARRGRAARRSERPPDR